MPGFIIIHFFLIESPLFLATRKKYETAVNNLNIIAERNNKEKLSESEEDEVYTVIPSNAKSFLKKWKIFFD